MKSHNLMLSAAGILLVLCAAGMAGQNPGSSSPPISGESAQISAGPPSSQDPTAAPAAHPLRTTTRIVQVSVLVHDKKGNPIPDLTKSDFVVFDEKKQREIQSFSVETNAVSENPPSPLPPGTYSNRIQKRAGVPTGITIVLFDALNTSFSNQATARRQVIRFLRRQIQPQDRVALYSLGQNLTILHDFTSDTASLLAALSRYEGQLTPELAASVPQTSNTGRPAMDAFLNNAFREESNFVVSARVRRTVIALKNIANHVSVLPGRKNLVWVSGSFPFSVGYDSLERHDDQKLLFGKDIEDAAQALTDANIAVYPVDARGLMAPDMQPNEDPSSPFGQSDASNPVASFRLPGPTNFDTMEDIAKQTGGRAFYNTNDIFGSIRQAIDDSRLTYELGFYPDDIKWNGSFHALRVQVKRPGAVVRARKGYFAWPEPKLTPQLRQAIIAETATSPLEATGIGVVAQVSVEDPPSARKMRLAIGFDPRQFSLQLKDGFWVGSVDAVIVQLDNTNKIIDAADETVRLHMQPSLYERTLKGGAVYTKMVTVVPNAAQMRVILRDPSSGNIGDVSVPFAQYFPLKLN